jgi:Undecaprenyl-phosphate glucose phosphotransferase
MIRGRLKTAHFVLTVAVFLMPLAAFSVAGYIRFATHLLPNYSADVDSREYFALLLLTTILWAVIADHFELTSIEQYAMVRSKLGRVLKSCVLTYAAVLAATFFYRETTFSRLFIWMSGLNLFILTLCVHEIFRSFWARAGAAQSSAFHVLIVGVDDFAVRVAESLSSDRIAPCHVKGHVRVPGQICARENLRVFELSDIEQLAIGNGIDDVVIAVPPTLLDDLPVLRKRLSALCVPMRLALDVGEALESHRHIFTVGKLLMLDLQETPAESALYIVLKRAFDLLFSAGVLLFAAPVLLLIALAVKLTSAGPVLFVQERVGLNGKLFRMFKFRTMAIAPASETDTRWTVRNDPRVTRFGRILRQTGLDELPQFLNVLKGDMSVVGPRPERPKLVQRFMQSVGNYNRRHYLKVGITGWAQVNGWRGDTSIEKRIEYDLYYVRHWTLAFDLLIVALTFLRGFTDKNAY